MLTDAQATGTWPSRSYVESWLPRNVKEDSKVFFYFSGHGAPDTESKQAYLVPWDGDSQFLTDTGYPVKRAFIKSSTSSRPSRWSSPWIPASPAPAAHLSWPRALGP